MSITYRLEAILSRGKFAFDLSTSKQFRVVRTTSVGSEVFRAMTVEDSWPNKVRYRIEISSRTVIFGGSIPLVVVLSPLLKSLKLGTITAKLVEICEIRARCSSDPTHRTSKDVAKWRIEENRVEHKHDTFDDTEHTTWIAIEWLRLPTTFSQYTRDLTHGGIKIRHRIDVSVTLINPDGHVSAVSEI